MKKSFLLCVLLSLSPVVMAEMSAVSTNSGVLSKVSLQELTKANDKIMRSDKGAIDEFYNKANISGDILLAWQNHDGLTEQAIQVINLFNDSKRLGLFPSNYHVKQIAKLQKDLSSMENKHLLDLLVTDAALSYLRDISVGQPELIAVEKKNWLLPRDQFNSVEALLALRSGENIQQYITSIQPKHEQYHLLIKSLDGLLDNKNESLIEEVVPGGKNLAEGNSGDRVIKLNNRLVQLGFLDKKSQSQEQFDAKTKKAVEAFQKSHLLEPDGVLGEKSISEINKTWQDRYNQLIANIERWRWMPKDLGAHYLVVDIPSYEYYVVKDGEKTVRAKTIVGMAQRSTPVFMAPMNHIVFAPYWHIPRSMAVKDQLPKLQQDPSRLARSKIRVLDRDGNEIDPMMVDWSQYNRNNFPFRLRQDPGNYNALGKVKFMFPNSHAIYLHDTPQKSLFNKTGRSFSSGCIRIENPIELAEYFLKDQDWKIENIQKAYNGSMEKTIRLKEEMRFPVYTIYMTTAVENNGATTFRADIYDKDPALLKVIDKLSAKE